MYSAITHEAYGVILQNQLLFGINSAQFSYSVPRTPLNILGQQTSNLILNGAYSVDFSLSRNLLNSDLLLTLTGRNDLDLKYATKKTTSEYQNYIHVTGGAIIDYSISVAAAGVPEQSASFTFSDVLPYSGITGASSAVVEESSALVYVPQSGIQLNLGDQEGTNIVTSANLSINFNWVKENTLRSGESDGRFLLQLVRPITYTASVDLLLDDYMLDSFSFRNPKTWELKIYSESSLLNTFTMQNAELVGESVNLSSSSLPTVTLQYQGVG